MQWVFLSAHLDDAVLSCGGWISAQIRQGYRAEIWTLCAGDPPAGALPPVADHFHALWGTGRETPGARRAEDREAGRRLGVAVRHWDVPDCIYRRFTDGRPVIARPEEIFAPLCLEEIEQAAVLGQRLAVELPAGAALVAPLGLGGHRDHAWAHAVAHLSGCAHLYYADFPYLLRSGLPEAGWTPTAALELDEEAVRVWLWAIEAYESQTASLLPEGADLHAEVRAYARAGACLWRRLRDSA